MVSPLTSSLTWRACCPSRRGREGGASRAAWFSIPAAYAHADSAAGLWCRPARVSDRAGGEERRQRRQSGATYRVAGQIMSLAYGNGVGGELARG